MIQHDTPTSSNISRLKYDDAAGKLYIEFRSGKTYVYDDFSYDAWNQFISAPSAGQFFNQRIRDAYKGRPV